MTDVAVVGGGIVGLATARALALRGREVVVLEREPAIGAHQTSHNSGVVHAGIYYRPGSLKARLCREGADALYAYCAERGLAAERCGKLVVAVRAADLPRLEELERRSSVNGVPGVRMLGPEELRAVEPAARGLAALHSPQTGMTDFGAVAASLARDVVALGGRVSTGCAVGAVVERGGGVEVVVARGGQPHRGAAPRGAHPHVRTGTGGGAAVGAGARAEDPHRGGASGGGGAEVVRARHAVACAGAWSDRLAAASGARVDVRIVPFRGAYLRLRPSRTGLVRGQIYPVPDPALPFLGVHLSRTIGGDVLLGPTALLAVTRLSREALRWPGTARVMRRFWRTGLREIGMAASRRRFVAELARYVPEIGPDDVLPGPAGVRAQAVARDGALLDDFAFAETAHALHVLNAPSPAATAALAIAEMVADRVAARGG